MSDGELAYMILASENQTDLHYAIDNLNILLHEDTAYKSISRRTADMLNIVTGSGLRYDEGKESVDMCKAIEDMRNESMEKGMEKGIITTLIGLVKDGILTIAEAAKRANMTVTEFENKAGLTAAV